eukprot:scaffold184_cov179-Amphora_coffeaeformis.AAC.4
MGIETIQISPAYELVLKAKSQSVPKMQTPKFSPKSLWSPRSFRFKNGGRRRGTFLLRKQILPRTDEESSLETEEMVGFDCIETTSDGNPSILQRNETSESKRSLSSNYEQQIERRQSISDRKYGHELRESYSSSGSLSPSIEVLMTKLGSKSFASRVSKGTQHRSVSSRGIIQCTEKRRGYISTFTNDLEHHSSCQWSKYTSMKCDDGNDKSTYWTEATSRRTGANSKASYYYSYSASSSESSGSSSSEDTQNCEDEDNDYGSFSFASNSTISTQASVVSKMWGATVLVAVPIRPSARTSLFRKVRDESFASYLQYYFCVRIRCFTFSNICSTRKSCPSEIHEMLLSG